MRNTAPVLAHSPCRSRTRPTLQGLPSAHPPDRAPARRLMRKTRSTADGCIVSFHQTPVRLAPDTTPDAQYRAHPTRIPRGATPDRPYRGLPPAHPPDRAPARRLMRKTRSMKNGYIVSFHQTPLGPAPATMLDGQYRVIPTGSPYRCDA
jgi:hypothetical protein